jgi:hypothetical protein
LTGLLKGNLKVQQADAKVLEADFKVQQVLAEVECLTKA